MKIPKLEIKKIRDFLKKGPKILGAHAFLTFLGLLLLSLIGGGFIFYRYSILVEKKEIEISEMPLQFKEKTYQEVLTTWQEKEKRLKEADLKKYPDPFQGMKVDLQKPETTPEEEEKPEETLPELTEERIKKLQTATNLFEFYLLKEEYLLSIMERAIIWEEKGLGTAEEYQGWFHQNVKLLEELKKGLTE